MRIINILLLCFVFSLSKLSAQTISLQFSNIRNSKGVFRVGFFSDEATYQSGAPTYYLTIEKKNIVNGSMQCLLDSIIVGTYGIVVLDDENSNDKTDYAFLMIPKEGFGLSNYPITKVRVPKFEDFKFELTGNIAVSIILKYL